LDISQTLVLALLQGLTEFLPISSSAHLILPAQLLGWVDQGLAFDVAVHVGTLAAVALYFRRDLYTMAFAWFASVAGKGASQDGRLAWHIILATIPTVIAGLLFNSLVEEHLRSTAVIAITTVLFGVVLFLGDRYGSADRTMDSLLLRDVLIIGCAQILALIPGTSRSGITITAGLALGLTRVAAARFSFLLSVPIILAAGSYKTVELVQADGPVDWLALSIGVLVAFISAYLCIGWFLKVLDRVGLLPFVIYRLMLGAFLWFYFV
jgi:undecaprenyl-diphosphatase